MMQPPIDISTHGHKIHELFMYITLWDLFYFALVCVGIFGFSYVYSHKRSARGLYTYGYQKKQVLIVTIIGISVFIFVDMAITYQSNNDLRNVFWNYPDPEKEEVVRIQVLAQQWAWNFRYAGPDNLFNTDDDVVTVNDLRLPKDKKVLFHLTAKDVIHSFYLPFNKLKVDTIPGRVTRLWTDFNRTGVYEIACAEMCGTHHYLMKAHLTVYEQADFDQWLKEAEQIALATNDPENLDLYWGWRWDLIKK
jgi:cytochrome c oxidase subunit 2